MAGIRPAWLVVFRPPALKVDFGRSLTCRLWLFCGTFAHRKDDSSGWSNQHIILWGVYNFLLDEALGLRDLGVKNS